MKKMFVIVSLFMCLGRDINAFPTVDPANEFEIQLMEIIKKNKGETRTWTFDNQFIIETLPSADEAEKVVLKILWKKEYIMHKIYWNGEIERLNNSSLNYRAIEKEINKIELRIIGLEKLNKEILYY